MPAKHSTKAGSKNGIVTARTADRQPVKNQDPWARIEQAIAKHGGPVEFSWVKGHAGHPVNQPADQLATRAARKA